MKKSKCILFIIVVLCLTLISGNTFNAISADTAVGDSKNAVMSDALISALNQTRDDGNIDVIMWQKDINHEAVEKQVEEATSIKRNTLSEKADMETVQNYITQKRYFSMKKYEKLNSDFVENTVSKIENSKIIFVSRFSPVVIATMPKSCVYTAAKSSNVTYMDLFVNSEVVDHSNVANVNNGAEYIRNPLNTYATGKGVKIGQIETHILDSDLSEGSSYYFNSSKLHQIGTGAEDVHATLVAAIMVGQPILYNGTVYKGIAPDADLYYAAATYIPEHLNAIESFIASGVNIINMSAGFSDIGGIYHFFSQWIDHLAFVHDVHFVSSAGNYPKSPNHLVTPPGTAYNAIVVGNVDDSNILIENNAPSSLSMQWLNQNFQIAPSSCYATSESYGGYKPDIAAWGKEIKYGSIFIEGNDDKSNSGTSFAAPQVTGIIAQLCEINPSLLTNNSKVKAILAATAVYRAYDSDDAFVSDFVYSDCCMTNKLGAGIVNVVCAYNTLNAGKTKDVTMSGGTHYYTFTINVPSSYDYLRLAMSWIKKNSISGSHLSTGTSVINRDLANLKLEIFYGTNTSGTPVAWSDSTGNNLELLQFNVEQGGTYTVRITNHDYNASLGAQYISLAWY